MTVEGIAINLASSGIIALANKLTAPTTRDSLVRRARQHPDVPTLSFRQRHRLKKLLGTQRAGDALFDQDEVGQAALSAMIASHVFQAAESPESLVLAGILIAEVPGCLSAPEVATLHAFKLRTIEQSVGGVSRQLGEVGVDVREVGDDVHEVGTSVREVADDVREVSQSILDLRQLMDRRSGAQIDPDVLINGPLAALGLEEEYAAIRSLEESDPRAAAARLTALISRIHVGGHDEQTRPFVKQRAQLLTRAGDPDAADAWLPLVEDFLESGSGPGLHEAIEAWNSLIEAPSAPPWLAARIAVTDALESWLYGDVGANSLLDLATIAAEAGDPAGARWLLHAAEACLTDKAEKSIANAREGLIAATNRSGDAETIVRLMLAVADATDDAELWRELLVGASPAGGRFAEDLSALIHARSGRHAFWAGRNGDAQAEYGLASEAGARALLWDDAADWVSATRYVANLGDNIRPDETQSLFQREATFRAAGGGNVLSQPYDLHLDALTHLVETEGGGGSPRAALASLRRYQRRSLVLGAVDQEITSEGLMGRFWMQLGDSNSAIGHFVRAGDIKRAAGAAEKLTKFHDCYSEASSGRREQRAVALRVAAEEADLIPDDQVYRWAAIALSEAKKREYTFSGPDTYVNAYKLLEGLGTRFPLELLPELLQELDLALPRPEYVSRPIDDQIAHILINLGSSDIGDRHDIADRIAAAFEQTDDVASEIAPYANSLSAAILPVKDRLVALLARAPQRRIQLMNTTMTLVEIGDQSPALLVSAEDFVNSALNRPVAYTPNSVAWIAWVEEPAIIAKCLPVARRIELARNYMSRALDVQDIEGNRASYSVAFVNLGPHLPDEVRAEIFDQLYPLAGDTQTPTNFFDAMERQFSNPLGRIQVTGDKGVLRRYTLKALAALATDDQRREKAWRAAQSLIVTGQRSDSLCVADVGYRLSQAGFAPNLPWRSMAYSADVEMRRLAAALIPFLPEIDYDATESLGRDVVTNVRRELAISLKTIAEESVSQTTDQRIDQLIAFLRTDPSYCVRSGLPQVQSPPPS